MKTKFAALLGILLLLTSVFTLPLGATDLSGNPSAEHIDESAIRLPEGAVHGSNGHAYYIYRQELSWEDAEAFCREQGGHLATITSTIEARIITREVDVPDEYGEETAVWIGAKSEDKIFTWVTGEVFDFSNWAEGEPSYSYGWFSEPYVGIYVKSSYDSDIKKWTWNDFTSDSDTVKGFLCEWDNACGSEYGLFAEHQWGETEVDREPTCEAEGTGRQTCLVCGRGVWEESRTVTIPALGHRYGEPVVISGNALIPPIVKDRACTRCDYVETVTDWSYVWVPIVAAVALVGVVIGVVNYAKAFRKK